MLLDRLNIILKDGHQFAHQSLKSTNINRPEHSIILALFEKREMIQEEIAMKLGMDKGAVAKLLASLEKKKYVVRKENPDNRREKLVSLTRDGEKELSERMVLYDAWVKKIFKNFTQDEIMEFNRLVIKLTENTQKGEKGYYGR
ncbi:MAG: MarR family winged helix-turn-helix transcriptional regulator [Eubacteriaceae bacterium]